MLPVVWEAGSRDRVRAAREDGARGNRCREEKSPYSSPFTLLKRASSYDTFKHTFRRKILNWLITPPTHLGLAGKRTHILTVRGRKTGRRYSTPVQLVIDGKRRWLVAPYGEREWVKNARAVGEVELTRALKTTRHGVDELAPEEAAPVLREYLRTTPVVKRFFEADRDDPLEAFAAEAPRHPVFRLLDRSLP